MPCFSPHRISLAVLASGEDPSLSSKERVEALAHAATCCECQSAVEEWERLGKTLRRAPEILSAVPARAALTRLHRRLESELEVPQAWGWGWAAGVGVAMAILLLGAFLIPFSTPLPLALSPVDISIEEPPPPTLLAMLALFQGQVDLQAGDESAAVEIMCAAMRLARSYAKDISFYISLRVAQVTDEYVVAIIAAHFSSLSMSALQRLQGALDSPSPVSLIDALQTESRLFLNWVQAIKAKAERDSDELSRFRKELARAYCEDPKTPYFPKEITLEMLREEYRILETAWAEVLRLAAMPAPEEGEPMNDYLTKEVTSKYPNSLAQRIIPGFIGGMANQRRAEVSRAALKVAIALREGGSKLPQEVEDPESGIAFLCKKEGDGFRLEAKMKISGKHFRLHFK